MGNVTVGALLAARVFGRVEWLGLPADELMSYGLLSESERCHYDLANLLRRISGPATASPQLPAEINSALQDCHFDPLRLAVVGGLARPELVGHVYPSDLFTGGIGSQQAASSSSALPLADSHLHSGASMGLTTFVRLACLSEVPAAASLKDVTGVDQVGEPFSIGVIVAAFRHFVLLTLTQRHGLQYDCPPNLLEHWQLGDYWRCVALVSMGRSAESAGITWEDLAAISYPLPQERRTFRGWDLVKELRSYIVDTAETGLVRPRRRCTGLLGAIFLINSFLRSAPGEGLPSFVDRFDQMGLLRDSSISEERAATVEAAADFVFNADNVMAAEFRKSIYAADSDSVAALQDKIRVNLADHLYGFSSSGAMRRKPRSVTMPITYLRTSDQTAADQPLQLLHSIAPLWRLTQALTEVRTESPVCAQFIGGVDVVGNELAMPNWVFIPLLDLLGREQEPEQEGVPPIIRSCHAGESFESRLQGLRSIGELLIPNKVVDRIGHGLALDSLMSDFIMGADERNYLRRVVIDDLCWVVSTGLFTAEATDLIESVIAECNLQGRKLQVHHFLSAWKSRRSIDGFVSAGLSEGFADPPTAVPIEVAKLAHGDHLAFILLTHRGRSFPFDVLDQPLPPPLARLYDEFSLTVSQAIAEHIEAAISNLDVVVEACPTSNMRLAGIPRAAYLPIGKWQSRGIRVSLNSDDPLIFGSSVSTEADLITRSFPDPSVMQLLSTVSTDSCCGGSDPVTIEDLEQAAREASLLVSS